jgi:hypothetical protein
VKENNSIRQNLESTCSRGVAGRAFILSRWFFSRRASGARKQDLPPYLSANLCNQACRHRCRRGAIMIGSQGRCHYVARSQQFEATVECCPMKPGKLRDILEQCRSWAITNVVDWTRKGASPSDSAPENETKDSQMMACRIRGSCKSRGRSIRPIDCYALLYAITASGSRPSEDGLRSEGLTLLSEKRIAATSPTELVAQAVIVY